MRVIDAAFLDMPWYGSRPMVRHLRRQGVNIGRRRVRRGFLYLVAIMDWATRKVLARRLSNTMDVGFCVMVLEEALARFGTPDIFNTDQGSQFTSFAFTAVLKDAEIRISMDGRGRWMDNVFIERLWRSMKYECVYLHAFETGSELRVGLTRWIGYYNADRPHSGLAGQTPDEAYGADELKPLAGLAPPAETLQLAAGSKPGTRPRGQSLT